MFGIIKHQSLNISLFYSVFHLALSFLALLFLCGHFLLINTWMDGWMDGSSSSTSSFYLFYKLYTCIITRRMTYDTSLTKKSLPVTTTMLIKVFVIFYQNRIFL